MIVSLHGMNPNHTTLPCKFNVMTLTNKLQILLPQASVYSSLENNVVKLKQYKKYYYRLKKLYLFPKSSTADNLGKRYTTIEDLLLKMSCLLDLHPKHAFQLISNGKKLYDNKPFNTSVFTNAALPTKNSSLDGIIEEFPEILQQAATKNIQTIAVKTLCYIYYYHVNSDEVNIPTIMQKPFSLYFPEIRDRICFLLDKYEASPQTIHKEIVVFCNKCLNEPHYLANTYNPKQEARNINILFNYIPTIHQFRLFCLGDGYENALVRELVRYIYGILNHREDNPFRNNGSPALEQIQKIATHHSYTSQEKQSIYEQWIKIVYKYILFKPEI